jgi:hypothetical protein
MILYEKNQAPLSSGKEALGTIHAIQDPDLPGKPLGEPNQNHETRLHLHSHNLTIVLSSRLSKKSLTKYKLHYTP